GRARTVYPAGPAVPRAAPACAVVLRSVPGAAAASAAGRTLRAAVAGAVRLPHVPLLAGDAAAGAAGLPAADPPHRFGADQRPGRDALPVSGGLGRNGLLSSSPARLRIRRRLAPFDLLPDPGG